MRSVEAAAGGLASSHPAQGKCNDRKRKNYNCYPKRIDTDAQRPDAQQKPGNTRGPYVFLHFVTPCHVVWNDSKRHISVRVTLDKQESIQPAQCWPGWLTGDNPQTQTKSAGHETHPKDWTGVQLPGCTSLAALLSYLSFRPRNKEGRQASLDRR